MWRGWAKAHDDSLVYLIRPQQERLRDREPQSLRGLEIDDQLELRCLLHRQIGGLGAVQELDDKCCRSPVQIRDIDAEGHEATEGHRLAEDENRGYPEPRR